MTHETPPQPEPLTADGPELTATKVELLSEVLRRMLGVSALDNARHDFGDLNGGALQRPTEVAAELLRALSDECLTIDVRRDAARLPVSGESDDYQRAITAPATLATKHVQTPEGPDDYCMFDGELWPCSFEQGRRSVSDGDYIRWDVKYADPSLHYVNRQGVIERIRRFLPPQEVVTPSSSPRTPTDDV